MTPQTITNCFKVTGTFPQDQGEYEDPYADLHKDGMDLQGLVWQVNPEMSADENADDGRSTCLTFEDIDKWREELWGIVHKEAAS